MAHGIMENDMMFSASNIRPWHGLGKVIAEAVPSGEAIKVAAMDWTVEQFPVIADKKEVPGWKANVRSDTRECLGLVSDKYQVMQNSECFQFMDSVLESSEGEAKYETAGSLFNGRKIFLLARLPNLKLVGDDVESYMFLSSSHDGSQGLTCGVTNVRVVCNNTLQLAERNSSRIWKVRHMKNIQSKAIIAKACLLQAVEYQNKLPVLAMEMAAKKVQEEAFFRKLFGMLKMGEEAKEDAVAQIAMLHKGKDDVQNFRGTAWGLYNATADWVSHVVPQKDTYNAAARKMEQFMDGYAVLDAAQKVLEAA